MTKNIITINNKVPFQDILKKELRLTDQQIDTMIANPLRFDSIAFPPDVLASSLTRGYYQLNEEDFLHYYKSVVQQGLMLN